jgi:hypothetical protein
VRRLVELRNQYNLSLRDMLTLQLASDEYIPVNEHNNITIIIIIIIIKTSCCIL